MLRAKWVERNAGGWERNNNATRVCGVDRAVEPVKLVESVEPVEPVEPVKLVESVEPVEPVKLVESVELVEHTTWSGDVQYAWVGGLYRL